MEAWATCAICRNILALGVDQPQVQVEFWSIPQGKKVFSLDGFIGAFRQVRFSPDGRLVLVETVDGEVQLWGVMR
jgi:hypothetical protein